MQQCCVLACLLFICQFISDTLMLCQNNHHKTRNFLEIMPQKFESSRTKYGMDIFRDMQ